MELFEGEIIKFPIDKVNKKNGILTEFDDIAELIKSLNVGDKVEIQGKPNYEGEVVKPVIATVTYTYQDALTKRKSYNSSNRDVSEPISVGIMVKKYGVIDLWSMNKTMQFQTTFKSQSRNIKSIRKV